MMRENIHMDREDRYRLAEAMIQEAKYIISEDGDWDNYADVERCVHDLEIGRMAVSGLVHKLLNDTLQ